MESSFRNLLFRVEQDEMGISGDIGRRDPSHVAILPVIRNRSRRSPAADTISDIPNSLPLPPFRHAVRDADVLVAGKAESDKPFAVELPRRRLQQGHPPLAILD